MRAGAVRESGFTLIEMMIVVTIIGVLAAVAIPNYVSLQLRTKRAELPTNLDGIRNAERAYAHEWDVFTSCAAAPAAVPGETHAAFGHLAGDHSDWDMLGWVADGRVRGQYQVVAMTGTEAEKNFTATAVADLDGDGRTSAFSADSRTKPVIVTTNAVY